MNDLPFLLAGPILRRVEMKTVSVWVACSEATAITLSLWESNAPLNINNIVPATFTSVPVVTTKIGNKLHIALVTLKLNQNSSLNPISLYSYNLIFTKASGAATEDFLTLGLLQDTAGTRPNLALGYLPNTLPTFILPGLTLENIKIAHASCRKAHGFGKDSLPALDFVFKDAIITNQAPTLRPQQLFLTGDQIYADEVATPLMKYLMPLANTLIGKDETLTFTINGAVTTKTITPANFPLFSRQKFLTDIAKFTSDAAQNHLMAFGEFCAMYLMAWSNSVWADELMTMTGAIDDNAINAIVDNHAITDALPQNFRDLLGTLDADAAKRTGQVENRRKQFRTELDEIIRFRDDLPKIKRLLANIPTYMICDDHEITDDWYLNKRWKQQVFTSLVGNTVLRNGILAYSIFQDWGNNPAAYEVAASDKKRLKEMSSLLFDSALPVIPKPELVSELETKLGIASNDAPPVKWHYNVPTGPIKTFVLDTRTRRSYDRFVSPPGLLDDGALGDQLSTMAAQQNPDAIMVVSPAPVLGMALFEEVIQKMSLSAAVGNPGNDYEAWAFNAPVFEKFLAKLHPFKKIILLSGDVHYGFTMLMDYWKKSGATYEQSKIVQLVSSACKNETDMVPQALFINGRINQMEAKALLPAKRLGWNTKPTVTAAHQTFKNRLKLQHEPVLFSPGKAWGNDTVINPTPDWAWRFDNVMDIRPENQRPEKIRMELIADDSGLTADPKGFYEKVLHRHAENFRKNTSRRFVWMNNIGIVTFKKESNELVIEHELWHYLGDDEPDDEPQNYTLFKAKMAFAPLNDRPTIP